MVMEDLLINFIRAFSMLLFIPIATNLKLIISIGLSVLVIDTTLERDNFISAIQLGIISGLPFIILFRIFNIFGEFLDSSRGHNLGNILNPSNQEFESPLALLLNTYFLVIFFNGVGIINLIKIFLIKKVSILSVINLIITTFNLIFTYLIPYYLIIIAIDIIVLATIITGNKFNFSIDIPVFRGLVVLFVILAYTTTIANNFIAFYQ
jgi:type III secretory pathway component EscT